MDEDIQSKMMEMESYRSQLQQYQMQKSQIMLNVQELLNAKTTLEGIKSAKNGTEIMIPIGGGTFIKGKIEDTASVVTSVGADVAVTKNIEDAEKFIEKQLKLGEDTVMKIESYLQAIEDRAACLYNEIESATHQHMHQH